MIEIQTVLKDSEIYADESSSILSIIELSYSLAIIDIIEKEDQKLFRAIEADFRRFTEVRTREIRFALLSDSIQHLSSFRQRRESENEYSRDRLWDTLIDLHDRERREIEDLYDKRIKSRFALFSFFVKTNYLDNYQKEFERIQIRYEKDRKSYLSRLIERSNYFTYQGLSKVQQTMERALETDIRSSLRDRTFKASDFRDWLLFNNQDGLSRIKFASSANSLEYIISTLIIFGFDNYSISKDVVKLTYQYIKQFLTANTSGDNISKEVAKQVKTIEIAPAILRTAGKYNEVDIDYDLKNERVIIKLKR